MSQAAGKHRDNVEFLFALSEKIRYRDAEPDGYQLAKFAWLHSVLT